MPRILPAPSRFLARWAFACLSLALLNSCAGLDADNQNWRVIWACEGDREASEQLELRVIEGGCDGEEAAYQVLLNPGDRAPTANELPPGEYGFAATALAEGAVVAHGCVEGRLPSKAPIEIVLRSPNCTDSGIIVIPGRDAAGPDGSKARDDGGDGDGDGDGDSGGDPSCPGGCDDDNECTEDTCVAGVCKHEPYDQMSLDCDGIACTVEDSCVAGVCKPGRPDDALCDDMNPCNAERCLADIGCVSTNLNGNSCEDGLGCTFDDVCVLGRCVGTNSCTDGQICDPLAGTCAACTLDAHCDDNNPCTIDECSCDGPECTGGVCSHRSAPAGTSCDDGIDCTAGDVCMNGACNGRPVDELCDDGNECTEDRCAMGTGCTFANVSRACDDGVACTIRDLCVNGTCIGQDDCFADGATCSLELGVCALCEQDADCDDKNPCTDDACMAGRCRYTFNTASCDDGVSCTTGDVCAEGVCQRGTPNDDACFDNDPCTDDICGVRGCEHPFGTAACDDGVACTANDTCQSGVCRGESSCEDGAVCKLSEGICATCEVDSDCDDGNPCTDDACMGAVCVYTANTASCDDGIDCTTDDLCSDGTCSGTPKAASCDDGNPCTDDACEPGVGCTHSNNTRPCSDGIACTTGAEVCQDGVCKGTSSDAQCVDDGDPCTSQVCAPGLGCTRVGYFGACDDGVDCTEDDSCQSGVCAGNDTCPGGYCDLQLNTCAACTSPADCDDGNVCTDDVCGVDGVCSHTNNTASCDDKVGCTTNDVCSAGECHGTPTNSLCDDDNSCTLDVCHATLGCQNPADPLGTCTDNIACTVDACVNGECVASPRNELCNDGNPCTTETCKAGVGCVPAAYTGSCNDEIACTSGDSCATGTCQGTSNCTGGKHCNLLSGACAQCLVDAHCNDGNPCTTDICGANGQCVNANNANACDDGVACTVNDVCSGGQCRGTPQASLCDDGNQCTVNQCHQTLGCQYPNEPNNTVCDDGVSCTTNDRCNAGQCRGTPSAAACNDNNACTDDECDAVTGCKNTIDTSNTCSDGVTCTIGDKCDAQGKCAGTPSNAACNDNNSCTNDVCSATTGCSNTTRSNGSSCDDGIACTSDVCQNGVCQGTPNCPPGTTCNATSGQCVACQTNSDCNDNNPCTDDTCDTGNGICVFTNDDTNTCSDGVACTSEQCVSGACQITPNNAACSDGNVCTNDVCVPGLGCQFPHNTDSCDDGIACTINDVCSGGACAGTPNNALCRETPTDNVCTTDVCQPGVGCQRTNNTNTCNDGVDCTINDKCSNGVCGGTTDNSRCNDENPCTNNVCTAAGCTFPNNSASCSDGLACTVDDVCSGGVCTPGASNCPSGATCGAGGCTCSGGLTLCSTGCVNLDTSTAHCGACGRSCPSGNTCQNGACKPSGASDCTARRLNGRDYLFCTSTRSWESARSRCRGWSGYDLLIVDNATENAAVQPHLGGTRWMGAHDQGSQGSCERNSSEPGEGHWYWVNTNGNDRGTKFCQQSGSTCNPVSSRYGNWNSGEPNNSGCSRECTSWLVVCLKYEYRGGEDCGQILTNGKWNDGDCGTSLGYVCEAY